MKKIILLISFLFLVQILTPAVIFAENIDSPTIYPSPIISWGNSSYHDSLGVRDPYVVKDQGTYYLYYDCTEDLLNPSFESNLGANGWDTWQATAVSTNEKHLFGNRSLKVTNLGTTGGGAYTGRYFFGENFEVKDINDLATPEGLEVTSDTTYIASAWVWVAQNNTAQIIVQQYKDDPYGNWQVNRISDKTTSATIAGNNNWQRIFTKFTTAANATAITISFTSGLNQTTYWDGVQLERVEVSVNDPSAFPTDQNYNYDLEDTVGWRTCLATSTDGINFQKKGQISVVGTRGGWETKEKPGWVGISGNYMSPFYYQDYWYSYTWVAGYELGTDYNTKDPGEPNVRRKWYGDRRAFIPNGNPSRSGLVRSQSLLGPFEKVSPSGPQINPLDDNWGQVYVTANSTPQNIGGTWVLFLAGAPGTADDWNNNIRQWTTISPGLATGNSPLGPWTVTGYTPILPDDLEGFVPEGPIYYFDRSGTHFMFINNIGGNSSVDAYWTNNPLAKWLPANKKTVVSASQLGGSAIGLSTVVEKDNNTLLVYFAIRPPTLSNPWKQYLFHNIGLATLSLPLFTPTNTPTPTPTPKPGDFNGDGHVNQADYDLLVANFGNPYTIFDYNVLVGNWGK